jgi:hypothetical protein
MYQMQEYKVIIYDSGTEFWYNKDNQPHRDNDKPAIIFANGTQYWYQNGKRHRDGGPAIVYADGDQSWYKNGKLHRVSGPAITYADGAEEYWVNGKRRPNPKEFKELTVADIEKILGYRIKVVK